MGRHGADCGGGAVTIPITATLDIPWDKDTVIDGNRLITLDGQNSARIIRFYSDNWQNSEHRLTLQHIALVNGKAADATTSLVFGCSLGAPGEWADRDPIGAR